VGTHDVRKHYLRADGRGSRPGAGGRRAGSFRPPFVFAPVMERPAGSDGPGGPATSSGDGEPARPRDLLGGSQGDLQEAERLQLASAAQRAASMARRPPAVTIPESSDLASPSSPAISTVVGCPPRMPDSRLAANVVLNAFSTRDRGSRAAISAAAEPSAGTRRESSVAKSTGLEMSTMTVSGELLTALRQDARDRTVGDGEHYERAADGSGRVALAEQLDGVAPSADDGADGRAHAAGADDAHACRCSLQWRQVTGGGTPSTLAARAGSQ
jgi:hypothetical protein